MDREQVGMIVIGRNEGEQLRRCFESIRERFEPIVYVDSGSTDGSVGLARSMGIHVVELDMSRPFTAARARNEGFELLMKLAPDLTFFHTLDGDVELIDTWIESALRVMKDHPKAAVLSGLRKEKFPDKSVFIRMCDIEWNKPDGYPACEGDAILRVEAFKMLGGFNPKLIAGEEPELCLRFWQAGYECLRNRDDMTWHDVGLYRFSQWWKRETRTGYAYAEGAAMYGKLHYLRQAMGVCFWGAGLPIVALALAWWTYGLSILVALAGYGVLWLRAYRGIRPRAKSFRHAAEYCFFNVLTKFPMLQGMMRYAWRRATGRTGRLIEYRAAPVNGQPKTPSNGDTKKNGSLNHATPNGGHSAPRITLPGDQPVGIGIIGAGHVTERHHLPTLAGLPDAKVVALCDLDRDRLTRLADLHQVAARYTDYRDLLRDPKVQVVAVLVPPQFHVPLAMDALEAGKHIFIEKPLAARLDGTRELVRAVADSRLQANVGFMLRSHRLVQRAREIVRSGALGKVEMVRTVWTGGPAHRLTLPGWIDDRQEGGGVLVESGVHHYDMWRFLTGREVTEVFAIANSQEQDDTCAVINGRLDDGTLTTSYFSKGTSDNHELEVYGNKGRLRVSVFRSDGLEVFSLHDLTGGMKARVKKAVKNLRGLPEAMALKKKGGVFNESYIREWQATLDAVRGKGGVPCPVEDGRRSLALGWAAVQSVRDGHPVAINKDYVLAGQEVVKHDRGLFTINS
ncbi:MAG: glycosyltransferase [Phycisphaera sp.]|nr:glycosyltransferase [Phycisphaera sp.]